MVKIRPEQLLSYLQLAFAHELIKYTKWLGPLAHPAYITQGFYG
jgi:hypothetical protein